MYDLILFWFLDVRFFLSYPSSKSVCLPQACEICNHDEDRILIITEKSND